MVNYYLDYLTLDKLPDNVPIKEAYDRFVEEANKLLKNTRPDVNYGSTQVFLKKCLERSVTPGENLEKLSRGALSKLAPLLPAVLNILLREIIYHKFNDADALSQLA